MGPTGSEAAWTTLDGKPGPSRGARARRGPIPLLPGVAVLLFAGYALVSLLRPMRRLVMTVSDDASYYLEIARRVVGGTGVSFDGIHPTNGFHPLWESLLILLQAITRAGPESQLRLVLVLQIGLLVMAAIWIWRGLEVIAGARGAMVGLVTFLVLGFLPAVSGMESALVWFLLAGFLARAPLRALDADRTWRRGAEIGAWLGLLALARLDLVFFIPLGLVSLSGGALLAGGVVLLLLLGPYLAWNLTTFGHLVPISGALKTSFPDPGWYLGAFKFSRLDHAVFAASLSCVSSMRCAGSRRWIDRVKVRYERFPNSTSSQSEHSSTQAIPCSSCAGGSLVGTWYRSASLSLLWSRGWWRR